MNRRAGQAVSLVILIACVGCSKSKEERKGGDAPAAADPAAAPASGEASSKPAAGPARTAMECPAYLERANAGARAAKLAMSFEAGSWAGTPAPLQELPAGATLCGGYKSEGSKMVVSSVVIRSPLFGSQLRAAYEPIMKKAGCSFRNDASTDSSTHLSWNCPQGGAVTILTEGDVQYYSLASAAP